MNLICEINKRRKDKYSFAIMAIEIESFPDNCPINAVVALPLIAIIAAVYDEKEGWSFENLSDGEKECIRQRMRIQDLTCSKWYWCNLYETPLMP